jgi:pimeloyl-ACP methyl ester carboxylesterase
MVERHFVTINGRWAQRQVHYRRCGTGPAVLLLHQSPQSSLEYEQHMLAWAEDFTVIAPDHPGYGLSDPLGADDVSLEDFADALAEFLQAIGVQSAAVYGFHTGAGMAVALAAQHPEKVSAVYANGYVVLSDAERDHILSEYLPPFIPQWDGSHLNWVWSRNRDQLTFFPWFDRRLSARFEYTLPPPATLQQGLLEFLRAGDNYRVAYRAAFCFPGDKPLQNLQVPAIITATSTDVLRKHLDKITEVSKSVTVKHGGSLADNLEEARAYFSQHPGSQVPNPPQEALLTNRLTSRTIEYDHGQLRIRHSNNSGGMPILLIHGAGRSSQNILSLANAFVTKRPVVTLDLPGHGESDSWPADVSFVDASIQAIDAVLNELGIESVDAWGEWAGGSLLCEFALRSPERVEHLALTGAQLYSTEEAGDLIENYAPEIVPVWHGGHLQEYWHRVRSESLFWPWYAQTTDNIIWAEPRLDTVDVHERVLALLQSAGDQHRVHVEMFAYPLANSLADCAVPVLISTTSWDPNREHSVTAAATNSKHSFVELADEPSNWCAELLNFFAGAKSNG